MLALGKGLRGKHERPRDHPSVVSIGVLRLEDQLNGSADGGALAERLPIARVAPKAPRLVLLPQPYTSEGSFRGRRGG